MGSLDAWCTKLRSLDFEAVVAAARVCGDNGSQQWQGSHNPLALPMELVWNA
jgi:hypothetical protein